jgi:hypothetical protein
MVFVVVPIRVSPLYVVQVSTQGAEALFGNSEARLTAGVHETLPALVLVAIVPLCVPNAHVMVSVYVLTSLVIVIVSASPKSPLEAESVDAAVFHTA